VLAGSLNSRLTSVISSPPARGSILPYYRSAGHRLFSLRMTLSRGRGWSNGLECDSKFVRCLILLSWMTSCTAGIPRSLWIISLVTYRGASTIALNIFDWHLYMTAILDLQAQAHNSMPYVHIGAIMNLYSRSLLSTDRWDFLPSNQLSSLCCRSICFRFLTIWSFQFNLLSKCNPRYFTVAAGGISTSLKWIGGLESFRNLKVSCADFDSLILIFHVILYLKLHLFLIHSIYQ